MTKECERSTANPMPADKSQANIDHSEETVEVQNIVDEDNFPLEVGQQRNLAKESESSTANPMVANKPQATIDYPEETVDVQNIVDGDDLPEPKVEATIPNEPVVQTTNLSEDEQQRNLPRECESSTTNPMVADKPQTTIDYPEKPVDIQNVEATTSQTGEAMYLSEKSQMSPFSGTISPIQVGNPLAFRKANEPVERTTNLSGVGQKRTLTEGAKSFAANPMAADKPQATIDYPEGPVGVQNIVDGDDLPEPKVEAKTSETGEANEPVEQDASLPEEMENSTANPVVADKTQEQSDIAYPEERVDVQNIRDRIRTDILTRVRTRTSNEYREIRLQLSPEHLGKVVIKVSQDNGTISAHIQASTQAAKEIIESELNQLRDELTNQGINIEELNVSVESETSGFQQRSNRNPPPATPHNRTTQSEETTTDDSPAQNIHEPSIVNLMA